MKITDPIPAFGDEASERDSRLVTPEQIEQMDDDAEALAHVIASLVEDGAKLSYLNRLSKSALDEILGYGGRSGAEVFAKALQRELTKYLNNTAESQYHPRFQITTDYPRKTEDDLKLSLAASRVVAESDVQDRARLDKATGILSQVGALSVIADAYDVAFWSNPEHAISRSDFSEGLTPEDEELRSEYLRGLSCLADLLPAKTMVTMGNEGRITTVPIDAYNRDKHTTVWRKSAKDRERAAEEQNSDNKTTTWDDLGQ